MSVLAAGQNWVAGKVRALSHCQGGLKSKQQDSQGVEGRIPTPRFFSVGREVQAPTAGLLLWASRIGDEVLGQGAMQGGVSAEGHIEGCISQCTGCAMGMRQLCGP